MSPPSRPVFALTAAAWLFAITTLGIHQRLAVTYLELLDGVAPQITTIGHTPLRSTSFGFAADAQTWIRHALELHDGDSVRLRYTRDDNAPVGRPVHWNSAWAWVIVGAGELRHGLTGEPIEPATEGASRWLNFAVLMGVLIIIPLWMGWRFGPVASAFVALGIAASGRFYEGFAAGYVDHHGLLTACVLGLVCGAMGIARAWSPASHRDTAESARVSAVLSAIAGATGMWISAASTVPAIAIVALGAATTLLWYQKMSTGSHINFDAASWRLWGGTGGAFTFLFYLFEYFPHHVGLRLEVNHPLYALAWWSGAELVAIIGERGATPHMRVLPLRHARFLVAIVGVSLPVLVVGSLGAQVFSLLDPLMRGLHANIAEFQGVVQRARMYSVQEVCAAFDTSTLILLIGLVLLVRERRTLGAPVVFAVIVTTAFLGMGLWQERWLLNASGPLIITTWVIWEVLQTRSRAIRVFGTVCIGAILILPPIARIVQLRHTLGGRVFSRSDGLQPLYRDVAAALRRSQPEGNIILLSSPNASTGVGYYGRFQTIGTLYWENAAGIAAAARIYSASTPDEAAKLISDRHITHIALISGQDFVHEYYELLHPGDIDGYKKCFGYQLQFELKVPSWLQVLPYTVPDELSSLNVRVLLFKVVPGQSLADALYSLATAQIAWKSFAAAQRTLQQLTALVPDAPAPWVRRSEVAMARRDWNGAVTAIEKAVTLAPADAQAEMYHSAGKAMLSNGQPGTAVRLLRASLAVADSDQVAAELAWILATSADATVRDGNQALLIASRLVNAGPRSAGRLVVLAAACAESGRFKEAAAAQTAAIQLTAANDGSFPRLQRQLSEYEAARPWRE